MHIFIEVGGRLRGERLSYLSMYNVFALYSLPIIFSKIFSLAMLARLRFILQLECKHGMCFTNSIYIFFNYFWYHYP